MDKEFKVDQKKSPMKELTNQVPDDCIREILKYLLTNDLLRISEVSKSWYFSQISNEESFWEKKFSAYFQNFSIQKGHYPELEDCTSYKQKIGVIFKNMSFSSELFSKYVAGNVRYYGNKRIKGVHYFNSSFNHILIKKRVGKGEKLWHPTKLDIESKKFVLVGDDGVGKTCLLISYATSGFPEMMVPTVFDSYNQNAWQGKRNHSFHLWDTSGTSTSERLRPLSYPHTDCVGICFSVVDRSSFVSACTKWIEEVERYLPEVPIIFLGLKTDLRDNMEVLKQLKERGQRMVTTDEVVEKLKRFPQVVLYLEVSALRWIGLDYCFGIALAVSLFARNNFSNCFSGIKKGKNKGSIKNKCKVQ